MRTSPRPAIRRTSLTFVALLALSLIATGCGKGVRTEAYAPAAAGPMTVTSDDTIYYAVPQTGAIHKVEPKVPHTNTTVITLDSIKNTANGVTGIAADKNGKLFVAYLNAAAQMKIDEVDPVGKKLRTVWQSPETNATSTNHVGGALNFTPDGRLTLALGDRTKTDLGAMPQSLLGKAFTLDPAGAPGQRESVLAGGLIDPTAATYDPNGSLWIADNGNEMKTKLFRVTSMGDRGKETEAGRGPATGIAFFGGEEITLCNSGEPQLRRYLVQDAVEAIPHRVIYKDCSGGVVTLADKRVVFATPTELRKTL